MHAYVPIKKIGWPCLKKMDWPCFFRSLTISIWSCWWCQIWYQLTFPKDPESLPYFASTSNQLFDVHQVRLLCWPVFYLKKICVQDNVLYVVCIKYLYLLHTSVKFVMFIWNENLCAIYNVLNICNVHQWCEALTITWLLRKVWNMQFISVCTECITLSQILVYHFCTEHKTTLNMIKHAPSSSHQFAFNKKIQASPHNSNHNVKISEYISWIDYFLDIFPSNGIQWHAPKWINQTNPLFLHLLQHTQLHSTLVFRCICPTCRKYLPKLSNVFVLYGLIKLNLVFL